MKLRRYRGVVPAPPPYRVEIDMEINRDNLTNSPATAPVDREGLVFDRVRRPSIATIS
jgi:hypothetical protein